MVSSATVTKKNPVDVYIDGNVAALNGRYAMLEHFGSFQLQHFYFKHYRTF